VSRKHRPKALTQLALSPQTLTPGHLVVRAGNIDERLGGALGGVEAKLLKFDPFSVVCVEVGARAFARREVGDLVAVGVRPLLAIVALKNSATSGDVNCLIFRNMNLPCRRPT